MSASRVLRDWSIDHDLCVDHSDRDLALWAMTMPDAQASALGLQSLAELPPRMPPIPGWMLWEGGSQSLSQSQSQSQSQSLSLSRSRSLSLSQSQSQSQSQSLSLSRSRSLSLSQSQSQSLSLSRSRSLSLSLSQGGAR